MNLFEEKLADKFGISYLERIRGVRVGIAGAGGLGSNCALNLIRCGFKKFVIADLDIVEYSNLDRQFYFYGQIGRGKAEALKCNLLEVNPDAEIDAMCVKITGDNVRGIFSGCDVVVEAFDAAEDKKMIVEAFLESEKFIVAASGIGGIGRSDEIMTRRVKKNFVMIGDFVSDVCGSLPLSPRVNVAAAKQADAVVEYALGR
jgi:sulfur carrier protein ThiS adenylyltransferase